MEDGNSCLDLRVRGFLAHIEMKKFIILFSFIVLVVGCNPYKRGVTTYFEDNHSELNILNDNDFSSFNLLLDDISDKRIYFTGESHGIGFNQTITLKFLQFFNINAGVNYYLAELGYAGAYLINEYLETGDEQLLLDVINLSEGTYAWTKENIAFYKDIRSYNNTLSEPDRITIIGIDIEHQHIAGILLLYRLLPLNDPPSEISALISELIDIYEDELYSYANVEDFSNRLFQDIENNTTAYEGYLGSDYFDFYLSARNLTYKFDVYADYNAVIRENYIYENFKSVFSHLPDAKFYGQWGASHIHLKKHSGVDWIAKLINESTDLSLQNAVLTIKPFYLNCTAMTRQPYSTAPLSDSPMITGLLSPVSDSNITLYRLNGDGSPFFDGLTLVEYPSEEGVTVDYFQYSMLISNSPPTSPLSD